LADELLHRRERIHASGESLAEVEARIRYAWINRVIHQVVRRTKPIIRSRSEKADRVLTHPVFGFAIMLALMAVCFQMIYTWAQPLMDLVDAGVGAIGAGVGRLLPEGALRSLLVNGAVAGVGAVLVFLPQILLLFFFIAILEDCGYMARTAFLFDRWMRILGLNGRSFIPLLSSFACAVPGIMATRTIEEQRDRFVTILIAPLMSCSARLPVYTLFVGAFVPATSWLGGWVGMRGLVMLAMYLLGAVVAVPVALILKKTFFKGEGQAFLMEMPDYKWPTVRTILFRMYEQGREFCVTAGTMIFAVTIVIWALGYYPRPESIARPFEEHRSKLRESTDTTDVDEALAEVDREEAGAYLRQSFLGRMGLWIEPAVRPLGWDWRIGTAVIASFPAREVVIATMGTIYNLGGDEDESSTALRDRVVAATWPDGRPVFNLAVALSIMVFFALCSQCAGTLAVIKRETQTWRWPVFTFAYMTALAYVAAMITYQAVVRFI
jgi:ferrous iron transport protein B